MIELDNNRQKTNVVNLQFKVSLADSHDIELLVRHRLGMFNDVFPELKTQVQASEGRNRKWINEKLLDGTLVGFIAKTQEGQVAGSGCLWIREQQPRLVSLSLKAPYLMSVYTEEAFRRKGVARLVVQNAIAWAKENGYDGISLHASETGKLLYESLCFQPTNEMRLKFEQTNKRSC